MPYNGKGRHPRDPDEAHDHPVIREHGKAHRHLADKFRTAVEYRIAQRRLGKMKFPEPEKHQICAGKI